MFENYVSRDQLTIRLNNNGEILLENKKDTKAIVTSFRNEVDIQFQEHGKGECKVVKDGDQITIKIEDHVKIEIVNYNRDINQEFLKTRKDILKDQFVIVPREIFTLDR